MHTDTAPTHNIAEVKNWSRPPPSLARVLVSATLRRVSNLAPRRPRHHLPTRRTTSSRVFRPSRRRVSVVRDRLAPRARSPRRPSSHPPRASSRASPRLAPRARDAISGATARARTSRVRPRSALDVGFEVNQIKSKSIDVPGCYARSTTRVVEDARRRPTGATRATFAGRDARSRRRARRAASRATRF